MAGIYKIKNKITGKIYIGKSRDLKTDLAKYKDIKRLSEESDTPLVCDILRYGQEKFEFTVLEECHETKLNEREIYYINACKAEEERCNIENKTKKFSKLNKGLQAHNIKMRTDPEYRAAIVEKFKKKRPNAIPVDMLDKDTGVLIRKFAKLMDGAAWIRENTKYDKADYATINKVCNGIGKTVYGYKWRYSNRTQVF